MINTQTFQRYAASFCNFGESILIDVDGNVRRRGDVMDPWQRHDDEIVGRAAMRCSGRSDEPAKMRVYLERPRGHDKTSGIALVCCWLLAFASRPLKGYAFAADKDQAALLKDAMETLIRLNPWLGTILEVQKDQVVNIAKGHPGAGSRLEISSSDVGSSYGILPDFIVADELTHWEGDGSLFHSIISSAAKRSNCLLLVIANAGFVDSWPWLVRETARTDEAWDFSRLDGPKASWLTPERLAEQRRMLPAIAYSRLWENNWSSGGGDALTESDINKAFLPDLQPMNQREKGYLYIAGVDLGLTRDCAAVVVLAVPDDGRAGKIRLAHNQLWRPLPGEKINLLDVEKHILELDETFGLEFVAFDPWQMEHLAQTLEADSKRRRRNQRKFFNEPWLREIAPVAANLRQQAHLTIEFFQDHRVQLYDCEPLRRDLHKLRVEEKSYGIRLVSPRDGEGHGDTFSAFALALVIAHEVAGKPKTIILSSRSQDDPYGFAARQREWEAAQQLLEEPDPDPSGLLDALREGRVNAIGQFYH